MINNSMLRNIEKYVKEKTENETTGHDWFHADRVRKNSLYIVKKEFNNKNIDIFLLQAVALMHDLGDYKINKTKKSEEQILTQSCIELRIPKHYTIKIVEIIAHMSYSSNIEIKHELPVEGKIVQDADRLDALGAIGIARAFAFGGKRGNLIYDPSFKPRKNLKKTVYKKAQSPSINHFYEKLFLLKDLMNTKTGKKMADTREKFMKRFLEEFYGEWDFQE